MLVDRKKLVPGEKWVYYTRGTDMHSGAGDLTAGSQAWPTVGIKLNGSLLSFLGEGLSRTGMPEWGAAECGTKALLGS